MPKREAGTSLIELSGGEFGQDSAGAWSGPQEQALAYLKKGGEHKVLARKVRFPLRGVWYVWIKATCSGPEPALLTYTLDGRQALRSARKEILIQPYTQGAWSTYSRFPNFRIEINVDEPGEHELAFHQLRGSAKIDKILLTLFYSAPLKGDSLDMAKDPGLGIPGPVSASLQADGFDKDWKSPVIRASGRTWYVDSEAGSDTASGHSAQEALKSLDKINAAVFHPGDAILLKRGSVFNQGLAPKGSGSAKAWISLGAYGSGERPLVDGINRPGLELQDQSYWVIQDLQVTNNPEYHQSGIRLGVSKGEPRAKGIRLRNCVAFDTGRHGISIGGNAGYDGVEVENCLSFCNSGDGIEVSGSTQKSARNMVVRHCTVYSNPGMAGIWIHSGENGLIEDCLAYNNACVNIWCWNAINVTMRRCEVFRGRPPRDAAGFDIDWGSQACTLEYCYSHHNEGDAVLLMGSGNLDYLGYTMQSRYNVMRYCVAQGYTDCIETFLHGKVYNNLLVARGKGNKALVALGWPNDEKGGGGGWPADTEFLNNVVLGLDGALPLHVDDFATSQDNRFDYNLYWKDDPKTPLIRWGGRLNGPGFWKGDRKTGSKPAPAYFNLEAFRKAVGQEKHGLQTDPKLARPGAGEYGRLPLPSARRRPGSPAQGAGVSVAFSEAWLAARRQHLTETGAQAYGIPMEPEPDQIDYWEERLVRDKVSIGPQK